MIFQHTVQIGRVKSRPGKLFMLIGLSFLLHFAAQAQDTLPQKIEDLPDFKNSISLSPLGLIGSLQVNYERLIGASNGLLAEGYYAYGGESEGTFALSFAYRYHFKKSLDGIFASAFYRWGDVHLEADFEENGTTNTYNMETIQNLVGLGLGYRKQWASGFAFVIRGGYGYQINASYQWKPSEPINQSEKELAEALRGLDLEISLGYSF